MVNNALINHPRGWKIGERFAGLGRRARSPGEKSADEAPFIHINSSVDEYCDNDVGEAGDRRLIHPIVHRHRPNFSKINNQEAESHRR